MVATAQHERFRQLYADGKTDAQIARLVANTANHIFVKRMNRAVAAWRKANGLGPNKPKGISELDARIRELNAQGMTDREIARALAGPSKQTVREHRMRMMLPSNQPLQSAKRERPDLTDYDEIERKALAWRLLSMDAKPEAVAERVGIPLEKAIEYLCEMPHGWREGMPDEPARSPRRFCPRTGHRAAKGGAS